MKTLSILSLASIASMAAAKFVVIDKPVHARQAKHICEKKGYQLAKLKGGKHSNIKAATKALYKADVGEAWFHKLDGDKHHGVLFLKKPANFKKTRDAGDIFRAQCDGDDVCNELRAVLCDDGEKKSKKHSKKKGKKHGKKHGRKYYGSSSSSSSSDNGYCNPENEYCGEEPVVEEVSNNYGQNFDKKPAKYY